MPPPWRRRLSREATEDDIQAHISAPGKLRTDKSPDGTLRQADCFLLGELHLEVAALKQCLLDSGILLEEKLRIELHRQRFSLHGKDKSWAPGASLSDVLGSQDTFGILATAGPGAVEALRATCQANQAAEGETTATLHVWGGVGNGAESVPWGTRFDFRAGAWEPVPNSKSQCASPAAILAGRLYLCGIFGLAGSTVRRFSPRSGAWEMLPNMLTARHSHAMAVLQQKLYVCGGLDEDWNTLHLVERFDPKAAPKGCWEALPSMLQGRGSAVAGAVLGRLFVCGGCQQQGDVLSSTEQFDPIRGRWLSTASMLMPRSSAAGAVLMGKFYVSGGETQGGKVLSSAECFDPAKGSWRALPRMGTARKQHAAVVVAGKLYVCGGAGAGDPSDPDYKDDMRLDSVERFDPRAGSWEQLPQMAMPSRRAGLSLGVLVG